MLQFTIIPLAGSRRIHLRFSSIILQLLQCWRIDAGISCPEGWKSLVNGCFKFAGIDMPYDNARLACALADGGRGSTLPVFRDRAEWDIFFVNFVDLSQHNNVWIGGNDERAEGNFTIMDPVTKQVCPIGFVKYLDGQPDNSNQNEHCLVTSGQGVNDFPCDYSCATVCHIPNFVICGSTSTTTTAFATSTTDSAPATTVLATANTGSTSTTTAAFATSTTGDGKQGNSETTENSASIKPEYIVLGLAFVLFFIVVVAIACTVYCSLAKTKELTEQAESSPASGVLIKMSYSPPWKEKTASSLKEPKFANNIENRKQCNTVFSSKG